MREGGKGRYGRKGLTGRELKSYKKSAEGGIPVSIHLEE